jgi:hypothetical protein
MKNEQAFGLCHLTEEGKNFSHSKIVEHFIFQTLRICLRKQK